jgi:hypothetical protein
LSGRRWGRPARCVGAFVAIRDVAARSIIAALIAWIPFRNPAACICHPRQAQGAIAGDCRPILRILTQAEINDNVES